jgi:DnaJ-class molecular chaperone
MKLFIDCPGGCNGTGNIFVLGVKCSTCKGAGRITLTKYLRMIDHTQELKNVIDYEKYLISITYQDTRQNVYSKT